MNRWISLIFLFGFHLFGQVESEQFADSLYASGNFSKAIEIYERLEDPTDVQAKLPMAYTAIGNYKKALLAYERLLAAHPNDYNAKYDYGKLLAKTKEFQKASKVFEELINIDYKNPDYHYQTGLVLEELKDSTAINRYYAAFDLDHNHQKAIFKIAKHYLQQGKLERSNYFIDEGLSTYPENVELISLKAQNFYWQHNYKEAIKWFERLIELGESSEFIFEKLATSNAAIYEFEKAIDYRERLLNLNPEDVESYKLIASYYRKIDKFAKAETYLRKYLLLMDVPLSNEYATLGTTLNHQQKYKEAIEAFNLALKEDPKNENAAFFRAITMSEYYADFDAKIAAFENFKSKFPNSKMNSNVEFFIKKLRDEQFAKGELKKDSTSID